MWSPSCSSRRQRQTIEVLPPGRARNSPSANSPGNWLCPGAKPAGSRTKSTALHPAIATASSDERIVGPILGAPRRVVAGLRRQCCCRCRWCNGRLGPWRGCRRPRHCRGSRIGSNADHGDPVPQRGDDEGRSTMPRITRRVARGDVDLLRCDWPTSPTRTPSVSKVASMWSSPDRPALRQGCVLGGRLEPAVT